jgi:hypothetical protein
MLSSRSCLGLALACCVALPFGCGEQAGDDPNNPFLQDQSNPGKEDTAYMNPDGIEAEVDLEGDIDAGDSTYRVFDAPAELGQFALTYLRKHGQIYLESLAEDATSELRPEWLINGAWVTTEKAKTLAAKDLKHWRLRTVNAVLLFDVAKTTKVGDVLNVPVPLKPFSIMADQGQACGEVDNHIGLSQSVYWYLWEPEKEGCKAVTQQLKITVTKRYATKKLVYPEYDRLVADKKVTVVVLFGQIGDGEISEYDAGMTGARQMGSWLEGAGFKEVKNAPVGRRYAKTLKTGVVVEFDIYSPKEFSGLGDYGHFENFQKALGEHEIVVYDGHSMLGGSDFWARPQYPTYYQIYLYGGCLGYEYYVKHILTGKGGWQNVDILSSVVEVSAGANEFAAPALAKLIWALENGYKASWRDLLVKVRESVGDSTFGVSGVRDNCFTPTGTRCPTK